MAETLAKMIESRGYLLEFQRKQLIEDLEIVEPNREYIEKIMDGVLYKLLGRGWDSLTDIEKRDIVNAWKGE